MRSGLVILTLGVVALGAGALQLLPSLEYAPQAVRFLGDSSSQGDSKIPYAYVCSNFGFPHSVVSILFPYGFNGSVNQGEYIPAYIGVFPLLLGVVAIARRWQNPWVRFSLLLTVLSILYSFGPFSPLHGWLYVLVPKLWIVREANRMLYLASFGLAVLAGFGADALFIGNAETGKRRSRIDAILMGLVVLAAASLLVSGIFNIPMNAWQSFSIVMILCAYALYYMAESGKHGVSVKVLAILLIMFDLSAFDWTSKNRIQAAADHHDELARLLTCRNAVSYFRSLPGPFRVDVAAEPVVNIGDAFHILTNSGAGATLLSDYIKMRSRPDLLDVHYQLKPATTGDPNAVFADENWKIYRTANPFSHAWLVHQSAQDSIDGMFQRLGDSAIDYQRVATTTADLSREIDPNAAPLTEQARFTAYRLNSLELAVQSSGRSLLVVSELFDSQWHASVNGHSVPVYRVDGALRGVLVPAGQSKVVFTYRPVAAIAGAVLTSFTFLGMLVFWVLVRRSELPPPAPFVGVR
jgi:hypothetical protein